MFKPASSAPLHGTKISPNLYYRSVRSRDEGLGTIAAHAQYLVKLWTGASSSVGGSVAMGVNIHDSDLDLMVAVPRVAFPRMKSCLVPHCQFRGEREATAVSTRLLFCLRLGEVHIDINVMTSRDVDIMKRGLRAARSTLSELERINHVWHKYKLQAGGNLAAYETYKLSLYQRFLPEFIWKSDPDIRANLIRTNQVLTEQLNTPPPLYSLHSTEKVS